MGKVIPPCDLCAMFHINNKGTNDYDMIYTIEQKRYDSHYDLCDKCWDYVTDKYNEEGRWNEHQFPGVYVHQRTIKMHI